MQKQGTKKGYTLIEVTLFLAITVALFAPLVAGTASNLSRQRYQDSVKDAYNYLINTYSEAESVVNEAQLGQRTYCTLAAKIAADEAGSGKELSDSQTNVGSAVGQSECVIYGKLYLFDAGDADGTTRIIKSFDVLGDIVDYKHEITANNTRDALREVHADYLAYDGANITLAGSENTHRLQWESSLETTAQGKPFTGALLVVRSPLNGTLGSFFLVNTKADSAFIQTARDVTNNGGTIAYSAAVAKNASLYDYLQEPKDLGSDPNVVYFRDDNNFEINICVASDDFLAYGLGVRRRNIRVKTALPASSRDILLVDQDSEENQCA